MCILEDEAIYQVIKDTESAVKMGDLLIEGNVDLF